jgi:hypothetical protein
MGRTPSLLDFSGFSTEELTVLRVLGEAGGLVLKGALVAFGFLELEKPAVGDETFTTAFGSVPSEGWSYKWGGAGPPPPSVDLVLEANPFSLSPLISLGAGG